MMNPQAVALQQRLLDDATRKLQEHAYYMQQAMDEKNLPVVLDRAAYMVGELGGPLHGHQNSHQSSASSSGSSRPSNTGCSAKLNPKNNYYELYMRALEEMPGLEDYLFNLVRSPEALAAQKQKEQEQLDQQQAPLNPGDRMISIIVNPGSKTAAPPTYSMRELYDCVLYCPRVVSRLWCLPKIIPTQGQQQEAIIFVSCDKVFTETEEDSCENGCITVIFGTFNIMV